MIGNTRNDVFALVVPTIGTSEVPTQHSSHPKASHVQTKRLFAAIEVVSQISMACIQAVDLVRDRQAIDLTDDLGPASKSMGLSGRLSPRSEQRQSFVLLALRGLHRSSTGMRTRQTGRFASPVFPCGRRSSLRMPCKSPLSFSACEGIGERRSRCGVSSRPVQ
jgi:hypothetical protein